MLAPTMHFRTTLILLALLLLGCGGATDDLDLSLDEVRERAAAMDIEELEKTIDEYKDRMKAELEKAKEQDQTKDLDKANAFNALADDLIARGDIYRAELRKRKK